MSNASWPLFAKKTEWYSVLAFFKSLLAIELFKKLRLNVRQLLAIFPTKLVFSGGGILAEYCL